MHQLHEARGCNQNRAIMTEVLQEIDKINGADLVIFLQKHYPHMLDGPTPRQQRENIKFESGNIFPHYDPNILTYPRRQIFVGSKRILKRKVQEFLLDKLRGDYIIVNEKVYIEYLEKDDTPIADQIPTKNWLISQYRLRQ